MTENNGLPPGWAKVQFKDISRINYRDPRIRDLDDDLPVTFLPMAAVDAINGRIGKPQVRPLAKVRKGFTPFKNGDVLFAKITPSMENGKAAIAEGLTNGLGFGSTEFHAISLNSDVLQKWIFYFIRQHSFRMEAKASFRGTAGQLRVPKQFLEEHDIPLPSLPEQERIVAKIEELFTQLEAGVAELQQAKAQLQRYRQAVLKSAVEGELTREWRKARGKGGSEIRPDESAEKLLARILSERRAKWEEGQETGDGRRKKKYKEPAPPDTDGLPELPEGWVWASLSAITSFIADVDHKMPKAQDTGIPYVSTRDFFGENEIDFENAKKITEADFTKLCRKIKPEFGDILLSRYGTVGEVRIVRTKRNFQASYSIAILKMLLPEELTEFAALALKSEPLRAQIRKFTRATAQPDLGLGHIREFAMPFPPLAEQKAIVAKVERRLSVADEIEKELDQALARSERLRQSILKSAFEGRLV